MTPSSHSFALELSQRTIALVGLMGVGKSSVGRRLAKTLEMPFHDADEEIERAAQRTVSEIFQDLGETQFRDGEHRVIARLLAGPPHVLATGGGAFLHAKTRTVMKENAVTVWLKADLELLAQRVARRDTRPLLRGKDPIEVLRVQAEARYPVYAEADLTVDCGDGSHQAAVAAIIQALEERRKI
ncbi:MAG TPA: shikimate kinase [Caulobacteraceae bacterium]|jgi:shikimate kinase|nr:shikimate kinase [Caulobacteraceae bacterium]